MTILNSILIRVQSTIIEALNHFEKIKYKTLFVIDQDAKFIGTMSEGDVRRALINGKSVAGSIDKVYNKDPIFLYADKDNSNTYAKLEKKTSLGYFFELLPVVDGDMKVVSYHEYKKSFYANIASPYFGGNELLNVVDCISKNWISSQGEYINQFESNFSKKFQGNYSLATSNGTTALHLALLACGIGEGDEVIVPSLTFAATINTVLHANAIPVLVDSNEDSWCICPKAIEAAITPKTKAIIPVHIYGQICDMEKICHIAEHYNLKIIEDCAEATGGQYKGKFVGTFGDFGCFSFFANKIITTGEGGMIMCKTLENFEKAKLLRDHGRDPNYPREYRHSAIGYNYRMTNIQAAIGVAQLDKIDDYLRYRKSIEDLYIKALTETGMFEFQKDLPNINRVVWLVSAIFQSNQINREKLFEKARENGIELRPFFVPLHEQKIYKNYTRTELPVASNLAKNGINFPTSLNLELNDVDRISSWILKNI